MGATGLGLLLEEQRGEIVSRWRAAVERELSVKEAALAFAVTPLLREMSLALGRRGDASRSRDAWTRCAVLVRSNAAPAQLAREVKLLHRCMWEALRTRDVPVTHSERLAADEWLDEALAEGLERLERVRLRLASFEREPVIVPPRRERPRPPPLPTRAARGDSRGSAKPAGGPDILELDPIARP